MSTNIVIPEMGESVTQGVIVAWRKKVGEFVKRDETILELETDKITAEVPAPASGVLKQIINPEGDQVPIKSVVGVIDESATAPAGSAPATPAPSAAAPVAAAAPSRPSTGGGSSEEVRATPLAKKVAAEHGIQLPGVSGTGPSGRIREKDVLHAMEGKSAPSAPAKAPGSPAAAQTEGDRPSRRVRMSPLRARIAERLVEAKQSTAMLTTFNEADMSAVMALRKQYKEPFEKQYGVGLGFMPFFIKAVVSALKAVPSVNASIVEGPNGEPEIEYHDFYDIAVAVSTPKGLTVPVLRGCDKLSMAEIEAGIKDLATRARDGKLTLAELQGGTYTLTNGGVFGSLMSTPILNSPQTGILGMHAIKNRPVEYPINSGEIALRPMMYLAMSYDHRLIDGAESVTFLVHVKNCIEDPQRLLLGI